MKGLQPMSISRRGGRNICRHGRIARACTISATAATPICSPTGPGAGAMPGSSPTRARPCWSTRCSTSNARARCSRRCAARCRRRRASARSSTPIPTATTPSATSSSRACAEEMRERTPAELAGMMRNWRSLGPGAAFFYEVMGTRFDFEGITLTLPTRTFERELALRVGGKEVRLVEVGPAHTGGDTVVYVPADKTVFTGDILFVNGHPVIWAGPIGNWTKACRRILDWDVETVVPGHGPITDKAGVRAMLRYLEYLRDEAKQRFDAGMGYEAAARDISLAPVADWTDPERIVVNVHALYREFAAEDRKSTRLNSSHGYISYA